MLPDCGWLKSRGVLSLATDLIARGMATKQAARQLGISPKTCDHHIQRLYRKTGLSTRAGATLFALEHGLIGPG